MVSRRFFVRYGDARFPIDYDTDDGLEVLRFQIFSITSLLPDDQKIVLEDAEEVIVSDSSDLSILSENLRLVSLHDDADRVGGSQPEQGTSLGISDEQLARMLQEEEEALCLQEYRASGDGKGFERRIRPYISQVRLYEDPSRQQEARKTTPVDVIEEKALVSLWKEGIFNPSKEHRDHAFLLQLLSWFKQSFRWVNTLPCDGCGSETRNQGDGEPLPWETRFGGHRVEIHRCIRCSRITRFPRYNDPLKLLETRRGRCGEWANCFTLYCRAFGYDSRLILDFTDHVWTECFSPLFGRWMHLDPCEGIYDNPLLYEEGWNKKLTYIIAISKDGAHDVTKRYTRKWHEVLSRRDTIEAAVSAVLSEFRSECRRDYSKEAISILENRDEKESDELNSLRLYSDSLISLPGRRSGSQEWRTNRAETGMNKSESLSSSSCPLRTCVDDHICSIFSSLTKFLVDFQSNGIEISKVLLYFRNLKGLLLDLRSSSFRVRKATIGSNFDSLLLSELIPSLDEFLAAVSLKRDDQDTEITVSVAGNPTQAAVALIVASDVLDELLENLEIHGQSREEFVSIFSRFNRISSGQVVASGEELPLGISTSAFDGTRRYKWEEPHGAKGCWLIYKAASGKRHELVAYELMSADDCPERDPRDWIVEGSEDGGSSWYTLDLRKSQLFERRFQRKRYDVASSHKSNAFRFRFTSVRDPDSQSRLQIGNIDLYAKDK